jgi:hypothetical protein
MRSLTEEVPLCCIRLDSGTSGDEPSCLTKDSAVQGLQAVWT